MLLGKRSAVFGQLPSLLNKLCLTQGSFQLEKAMKNVHKIDVVHLDRGGR